MKRAYPDTQPMASGKWKQAAIHAVFILLFLSIPFISSPDFDYSFDMFHIEPFKRSLTGYVLLISFFYANYYFFLPRIYDRKRLVLYFAVVAGSFVILSLINNSLFNQHPPRDPRPWGNASMPGRRPFELPETLSLLVPFTIVFLFSLVLYMNRKRKQMELDKYQVELENLRYQLQPHFLFNSLNNIYALAMVEPEKTAGYIIELSEILRYLLQTDRSGTINISEDIRFCEQYIDLQALRFGKMSTWKIDITKEIRPEEIQPFLLIPFIENVFKYGVNPDKESPIEISIRFHGDKLLLKTYNRRNNDGSGSLIAANKIGLEKTRERLGLLFPGRHTIQIAETTIDFTLELLLKLK